MVYIGVDLHRKVSQVAAVQANGEVLWNRRIRSRPEEFAEIVGDLPASPAGVAFEATYGWAGSPTCWPTWDCPPICRIRRGPRPSPPPA